MKLQDKNKTPMQDSLVMLIKESNDNYLLEAIEKCPDKDMENCEKYITAKAKDYLKNQSGAVRSDVVFEWVKEYFIDYEARALKQKEIEERNKENALKQRIADTLTSVVNQRDTLKNNYPELLEKHKLNLIAWENELKTGLVKGNDRVDEINKGLALILDDINALRPKIEEEQEEEVKEPKKAIKKPVKEEIKQMSLFDF